MEEDDFLDDLIDDDLDEWLNFYEWGDEDDSYSQYVDEDGVKGDNV